MKKTFVFIALLLCSLFYSKGANHLMQDTTKADTAKINKKINGLKEDLTDYSASLAKAQNRLPTDSVAFVNATSKADDALKASKKAASNAVGGDLGDAKDAEKKAKKASNAQDDAHDAEKQLKQDRSDIIKYTKKIQKTQKKIDDLKLKLSKS
jgi:chromosome segregation ATPase